LIVDAPGTVTSWERVGELASQLSACASDIEQFLLEEMAHTQSVQRQLEGQVAEARRRFHPGSADPGIAAVLARFQQLEKAVGDEAAGE
jgi:hypothetical protein